MPLNADEPTLARIALARTYKGIPPNQYMVSHRNFAGLMDHWVTQSPNRTFLIHYDADGQREEFTYAGVNARVNQIANFMTSTLGLKHGQCVATVGFNHSDTVFIYYACWKLGLIVAPQNVTEDDSRIGFILKNSEAQVVFARQEYLARTESIVHGAEPISNVREIVQVGGDPDLKYRHMQQECASLPQTLSEGAPVQLDDEALLVYTSGTTGAPKGVVLTQYNLLVDGHGIAAWHQITPDTRLMCVLPIHHANGTIVTLVTPMVAGASIVLNRAYSSHHFWQRIAVEKVHIVSVVPTLLQFSLEFADKAESEGKSIWGDGVTSADLAHFRHLICGAGTLAVALATRFEARFGFPIMHGYGLSETTCYSCFLPLDLSQSEHTHWLKDFGYPSIGVPIETNEMAIFDPLGTGQQLGPSERGEICIRGHNVMKYYYQRPDANTETFKFDWFRSGDEGFYEVDEKGRQFFFISGRIKELINRGGVKFSPFDIEETLLELLQVSIALAVAFENDYYGEEVGAYIVLNEGASLTEAEVIAHCRQRMSFEKSPKVVLFGTEAPVTATGKYQRLKLRDMFIQWKDTQFRP